MIQYACDPIRRFHSPHGLVFRATTEHAHQQATGTDNYITSIAWIQRGNFIAIGTNAAEVQLWDTERLKQVLLVCRVWVYHPGPRAFPASRCESCMRRVSP